jgi:hypothetical protein
MLFALEFDQLDGGSARATAPLNRRPLMRTRHCLFLIATQSETETLVIYRK